MRPDIPTERRPQTASHGTWRSPLTAQQVAAGAIRLGQLVVEGDEIYWVEGRPEERGRNVIVRRSADGRVTDVSPPDTNVRTRVYEYGGASYAVSNGTVFYSEFADQRLYRLEAGGTPEPLTPPGNWFYADASVSLARRCLVCVREDHTGLLSEAATTLVCLPLRGPADAGKVIASGHDFYSTPRFNPEGSRLSWLAWRHPQMPWDGTELWIGDFSASGTIEHSYIVAGGHAEAIFQPGWSPEGELYFVSDRTGWWNLYRLSDGRVEAVCPMAAEFGRPSWQLGTSTWAFATPSRLVAACVKQGLGQLVTIDLSTGTLERVPTGIEPGESVTATETHAVMVGGSSVTPDAVVRVDLRTGAVETIRTTTVPAVDANIFSRPEPIEFPTDSGVSAYAFYYAPHNPDFDASPGDCPPLIVVAHGGPTAAANRRLNLELQYWTSRGFAVVDVNYSGSSGYGRAYRQRLRGQWGIFDVSDCCSAASHLVANGKADPKRLIIRGRSAGGYTTLAALTFKPGAFHAGASYYGVADLERLVRETHKFESRYLDGLIGPYPAHQEVYRARSPIHFVDRLSSPLILFQGLEDRIVPPGQSRLMADAVRARGLPVALLMFEGEQHGFRRAETIARCLETELSFYGAVFGFSPADVRPDESIENLDRWNPRRS